MTQEFRTFTQRLTDEPNERTRIFNVQAKTIVDRFGNDVVDSQGNKIWFPVTFDPAAAIAFGKSLASKSTAAAFLDFGRNVKDGGPWDLQRNYNGQSNALFASLFAPAASYAYGLIGAAAGFSPTTLMAAAGGYNMLVNPKTAGPNFGSNPKNPPFIAKGVRDYFDSTYGPPATVPGNSLQGSQAFASGDQFKTAFGRSFNGDIRRLVASTTIGNITPSVGFTDPTNADPHAGSFPQALDKIVPSPGPDGWLSSMVRNRELERIIGNSAITSPLIGGSTDSSGTFDSRFGNWGSVPAGDSGDTDSPLLRALEKYRRSEAPDGLSSVAAAPSLVPSNASEPGFGSQLADGLYAARSRAARLLGGAGGYIENSLIPSAQAASPSPPLYGSATTDADGSPPPLPVRRLVGRIVDDSRTSAFESGAPVAPSNGFPVSDRGDSFGDRFGNWASTETGDTPQQSQDSAPSYSEMFRQYLNQLTAGQPQAPASSPGINAPNPYQSVPPIVAPPDYSSATGNGSIDKWIASLAGVDPDDPTQFQVPPVFSPLYRR